MVLLLVQGLPSFFLLVLPFLPLNLSFNLLLLVLEKPLPFVLDLLLNLYGLGSVVIDIPKEVDPGLLLLGPLVLPHLPLLL